MIQLHVSKTFSEDLSQAGCLMASVVSRADRWNWYVHRVTLLRKKCIIAMEESSRYALILVGLKKPDFANFDKLLTRRVIAESRWVCNLAQPNVNKQLGEAIRQKCRDVVFSKGLDRSVQAHIRQVAEEMEILVKYHAGRLPDPGEEEFGMGLRLNKTLRKRKEDKDYFVPLDKWRDALLLLLKPTLKSNVVHLDAFRNDRRKS